MEFLKSAEDEFCLNIQIKTYCLLLKIDKKSEIFVAIVSLH